MKPDDRPPLPLSDKRSVILRLNVARQGAVARWFGRALTGGVAIAAYRFLSYLWSR